MHAPFDGIVSERKVSSGDTTQIGMELIKVIDPASMRFEGFVSADSIDSVKPGQTVRFRINGYSDQQFPGRVKRIDPAANAVTRQLVVLVDFVGAAQPKVAGLYAEGRIEVDSSAVLMLPESVLVRAGDQTHAWRLVSKVAGQPSKRTLTKVALVLGARDGRSGQWEVRSGLAAGDMVLRNPGSSLGQGQRATLVGASPASPATMATPMPASGSTPSPEQ